MTSTWLTLAPSERDTYRVICKGATLTSLANGFCFGEGPRWFEGLLWFSDMLGEAVHTVTLSDLPGSLPGLPDAIPEQMPEIFSIKKALEPLDDEAKRRVLTAVTILLAPHCGTPGGDK